MKKVNKFLALFLSWTLCLSLLPAGVFAAEENETLVIQPLSVSGDAGQTVEVPIVITQNPGVVAFGVQIEYDSTKLTLTQKPTIGDVMGGTITQSQYLTSNPYMVLFDSSTASTNITATGTLMTMSFQIKEDTVAGEAAIKVSFAANSRPINFDLEDVPFRSENGSVTIADHTWGAATYTWNSNHTACIAERTCACGAKETENGTVTCETIEPTCAAAGIIIYSVTFSNPAFETQVEAVSGEPAKGHSWSTVAFTWSGDNMACSAERTCVCGLKETEDGTVTSEVIEPTCTEAGTTVYTAVFTNSAFAKQEKTVVGEPAKGHDWDQWETIKQPTADEAGVAKRVCKRDESHVEIRSITAQPCVHACTACGGCVASTCPGMASCICGEESKPLQTRPLEEGQVSVDTSQMDVPTGRTIEVVATEVKLTSASETPSAQPNVNPYEAYILNRVEGYKVETVYEISLHVKETGEAYILEEGETVTVKLFVGTENAQAIDDGKMFLVHIAADEIVFYGKGQLPIEVEKNGTEYTGNISFTTDGLSTFALVSKPETLSIEMKAEKHENGCTIVLSANAAISCDLYIAVYDANGRMLDVEVIASSNLGANPKYDILFEETAAKVRAFMTEINTLVPKYSTVAVNDLND